MCPHFTWRAGKAGFEATHLPRFEMFVLLMVELFLQVFSFPSWGHAVQRILWGIILNKDDRNIIKIMNKELVK